MEISHGDIKWCVIWELSNNMGLEGSLKSLVSFFFMSTFEQVLYHGDLLSLYEIGEHRRAEHDVTCKAGHIVLQPSWQDGQ